MTAYILAGIDVHDPGTYGKYITNAMPSLLEHKVAVRALCDDPQILEGSDLPGRFVVLEFPDRAAAEAWYRSESYQQNALPHRHASAKTSFLVLIDDVSLAAFS